jgi:hypothetical protein
MVLWDTEDNLWLLTPKEFDQLPNNIELESIAGEKVIKGVDYIDNDTRGNYLAYGIRNPHEHALKHLFLTFLLKT